MKSLTLLLLSLVFILTLASDRPGPIIYEISTRPWLYELSNKYNTNITLLSQIPVQEWERIQTYGVDYVWMMGVWELGQYGLWYDQTNQGCLQSYSSTLPGWTMSDIIGSPYSIVNYTTNPQIGTNQDLINLRQLLNSMGLLLMLDFVPNHSAFDSPLISEQIEMYMQAPPNTPQPYNNNTWFPNGVYYGGDMYGDEWPDVAQFNYWNTTTFQYQMNMLAMVAGYADAVRCDMAMLIMNEYIYDDWNVPLNAWGFSQPQQEFWSAAIQNVKSLYPNTLMMAEVYWGANQAILNMGFDLVYDMDLLQAMLTLNYQNVINYITAQSTQYLWQGNHFVENHDQPRAVAVFGADYIANTAAMIAYTIPGARFLNHAQEWGYKNQLLVQLRRGFPENGTTYATWWYEQLMPIVNETIFHTGTWTYLNVNGNTGSLMAWKWTNGTDHRLCAINFGGSQSSGQIVLTDAYAPNNGVMYNITELMSGSVYLRNATQMRTTGLEVVIPAWNGQIFEY